MCVHTSIPLLGAAQVDALDFFIPETIPRDDISGPVKHKQSWSRWRGLSSAHAEDLAIYELAFRRVLQARVAAYVESFLYYSAKQDSTITVKVNLHELAAEIADVYHETAQRPSSLMNLPGIIQFIRLHDCFVRPACKLLQGVPADPKAQIRVKMSHNSATPVIVPYTPRLIFDDLVVQLQEGQNYYLKPRYSSVPVSSKHKVYEPQVTYTTPCGWLKYNEQHKHFAGNLPRNSGGAQNIEVEATVVYRFLETNIIHEEKIRAVVKIIPVVSATESDHPALVKHVRFAAVGQESKPPRFRRLPTRNSYGLLQNRSNMDQDRRHLPCSLRTDDITNAAQSPASDSDEEQSSSSSLASSKYSDTDCSHASVQGHSKQNGAEKPYSRPDDIYDGLTDFYRLNERGTREHVNTNTLHTGVKSHVKQNAAAAIYSGPEHIRAGITNFYRSIGAGAREHADTDSIYTGVLSQVKQDAAAETYSGPKHIHAGITDFYRPIGSGARETQDDGVATQIGENMRKACEVDFASDEDPRDVREMKKELMQMTLEDMSNSMLGYRVDRWSSEGSGELFDLE